MRSISILNHAEDDFQRVNYLLRKVIPYWEEMGVRTTVLHGTDAVVDSDAVLLHVNLTVIPPEYLDIARRAPMVINGSVTDISKRVVSQDLLERGSDFRGPVIVKTNLNFGGYPERSLRGGSRIVRGLTRRIQRVLPWTWTGRIRSSDYPIFTSLDAVPSAVWRNPSLVVEKFMAERDGDLYCLRQWVFLGDRAFHIRSLSASPVVKSGNVIRYDDLGEVPQELRSMRSRLGFDYGKFDYGLVDGRVILYDANRTPTFTPSKQKARSTERIENLAQGILSFAIS